MSENRILFVNGQVFDGTGAPTVPADLVVRGDRIDSVRVGGGTAIEAGDQVVDCAGATVMPGMVESHSHLTFPSAVGHIDPSFNPPLDVSFFRHMPTPAEHLAMAKRNAKILLKAGFTSAYSAGSGRGRHGAADAEHPARQGAQRGRGDRRTGARPGRDALLERRERRARHRPALDPVPARDQAG